MIDAAILNRLRCAVCGIGYLTVPYHEGPKHPEALRLVGTGFLVRDGTVMTNRHVVLAVLEAQKKEQFPDDRKLLQFVYPGKERGRWHQSFCRFHSEGFLMDKDFDVAFVEFKARPEPEFRSCCPVAFGDLSTVSVSDAIAACGYPYGSDMLRRDGKLYRFGPILQQGHISAIAPFDMAWCVDELLLDIRAAGGMSGSPVFRPSDASVIGMIWGFCEATTAVAVPLDEKRVSQWLTTHDQARAGGPGTLIEAVMDTTVHKPKEDP